MRIIALLWTYSFTVIFGADTDEPQPLLLLVAYDGIRFDFVNELLTPNLWRICRQGVWSPMGMKPQVITYTSPNFYSIATGLYQESHGIVGNAFYDPIYDEVFDYWNLVEPEKRLLSLDPKWYGGEPIWHTNEKGSSRHQSGSMRYPMSESNINNRTIAEQNIVAWNGYKSPMQMKADIDQLLSWFVRPLDPINFGMLYVDEPDATEHASDLYSAEVRRKLTEVDELTVYLMQRLEDLNLKQRMNLIFVSDHGHTNVCEKEKIKFDQYMRQTDYIFSAGSFFLSPNSSLTIKSLYTTLNRIRMKQPKFHLWLKNDIPDHFRYKRNRRVGPVFLMPYLGHSIMPYSARAGECHGDHGFSNEYVEMRPFFAAYGPMLKSDFVVAKPIENIDLYNLMCLILNVPPAPNNGSLDNVIGMLKNGYRKR